MSIESEEELAGLKKCGWVVAMAIREMAKHVRPGITTGELDAIGAEFLRKHGARSAPIITYNFPAAACISVNDEAAHGIPGKRALNEGDLVNLDVSAELEGYVTDSGATYPVGRISPAREKLLKCTRAALDRAMSAAQAGKPINVIGQAVEAEARRCNFNIVRNLTGHGVGRHIHEDPREVLNYYDPRDRRKLTEGMVLTIEPFLSPRAEYVLESPNGWTLKTPDGSVTAQFEHTLVITKGKPVVVTRV
jgi:methionyl aminopeptidase